MQDKIGPNSEHISFNSFAKISLFKFLKNTLASGSKSFVLFLKYILSSLPSINLKFNSSKAYSADSLS